jgi:hypothetical protein
MAVGTLDSKPKAIKKCGVRRPFSSETTIARLREAVEAMAGLVRSTGGEALGEALIQIRESAIDPLEAIFAEGVRRFDKSGDFASQGALSMTAWLKWKCRLSGGAAAERVEIARQLDKLPQTQAAFACGELGYQHVAVIAKAAHHVGTAAVRKEESMLLTAAGTMDAGQFVTVAKNFEHRVDASAALTEANNAYKRRYLHIGEPMNGLVRLDGLLDVEGGATVRAALSSLTKPVKEDDRSHGQRCADALVELCRWGSGSKGDRSLRDSGEASNGRSGPGPRPQLIIRASQETLAGVPGAPAGELEGGGTVPAETVQRHACDAALIVISGANEIDREVNHSVRTIPASTRRALEARDGHCVWPGCRRPEAWCDGHHLVWWTRGGKTELPNLALLCRPHHRSVHEGGWKIERRQAGKWEVTPPGRAPTCP